MSKEIEKKVSILVGKGERAAKCVEQFNLLRRKSLFTNKSRLFWIYMFCIIEEYATWPENPKLLWKKKAVNIDNEPPSK